MHSKDNDSESNLFLTNLRGLAHPLGEGMSRQGFTWEREWRFVDKKGFYFDFEAIEFICCPVEEEIKLGLNLCKQFIIDQ